MTTPENTPASVESYILSKRLKLQHLPNGFQTSIDSVLLAASCPIQSGQSLLDLGCGVGSAGLCVSRRVENITLTGVDIQPEIIALATQNAKNNALPAEFITADIRAYKDANIVDHVICNPPYLAGGTHLRSPHPEKATAMGHKDATLDDWIKTAHRALKPHGCMTLIHRADHLDKILQSFPHKFGAVEIIPLWPYEGQEAKRVIIRALKNRKTPARLLPGLVLHESGGKYTLEAENILTHMKGLCVP